MNLATAFVEEDCVLQKMPQLLSTLRSVAEASFKRRIQKGRGREKRERQREREVWKGLGSAHARAVALRDESACLSLGPHV